MQTTAAMLNAPAHGMDGGAKAEVYALVRGPAEGGVGMLTIFSNPEQVHIRHQRYHRSRAGFGGEIGRAHV